MSSGGTGSGHPATPRIRVVRTRDSCTNFVSSPRGAIGGSVGIHYEYPTTTANNHNSGDIIFIREPEPLHPIPIPQRQKHCHPHSAISSIQKRNCVNRFCSGLFNFFRFRGTNVGYKEELRYPSPALFHHLNYDSNHNFPVHQCNSMNFDPNNQTTCNSLVNFRGEEHWPKDENIPSDDGEGDYIIYIPRMSRSDLQKKYVDPLRRSGSAQPVFIQPLCRHPTCVGCCHSCDLERGRTQESQLRNQTRECSDHIIIQQRKKSRFPTSCHTSKENIPRDKDEEDMEMPKASGDTERIRTPMMQKDKVSVASVSPCPSIQFFEDSRNKKFFQIPLKSPPETSANSPRKPNRFRVDPFKIQNKVIHWDAIQERHNRTARNRQKLMQENRDKLQTHFAIWMRRTLIGQKKKRLAGAKDKENNYNLYNAHLAIDPPNMLESRYHHIHRLGKNENSNNSVGRYFDKEDNRVVALKIFGDIPFETQVENLDNKLMAIQEIMSLKKLEHKNIVKLLGYFELHDKYHLILESCDHSLREEILKNSFGLGTSISKKFIKHILNGLHFCHQKNCLHRDLSPENVLLSKNGVAKIADFDRSVFLTDAGVGSTCPTPGCFVYNSPEILAGDKKYGLPSDVWSLGVIFCEMLFGKPPWNGTSAKSQLREIHNSVGPLLPRHASIAKLQKGDCKSYAVHNHAQLQQMFTTISQACQSFIMKCLDVNPLCRFTCGELLQHKFMKGK